MTVLIVEDNPALRHLLRRALRNIATQVWECEDGADALAAYVDHLPDVVLMDIRMPRMDGLAATRQIRQFYPNAAIVIVTDYDDDQVRTAAREAGACGYALKQNLTELESVIGRLVAAANDEPAHS